MLRCWEDVSPAPRIAGWLLGDPGEHLSFIAAVFHRHPADDGRLMVLEKAVERLDLDERRAYVALLELICDKIAACFFGHQTFFCRQVKPGRQLDDSLNPFQSSDWKKNLTAELTIAEP